LEAGVAALNSGNLNASIPLLKRALELDPKIKEGWNNLGLAYLRLDDSKMPAPLSKANLN